MNALMKLAAVAAGALGIAGGAALAQTTSTNADTPNDPLNRTGVSAPATTNDRSTLDNGAASSVDSSSPAARTDRN